MSHTSHQIRAALRKAGWGIEETLEEVRLFMPGALTVSAAVPAVLAPTNVAATSPERETLGRIATRPWCWEGNVVCAVATFLMVRGWTIEGIADTEKGEAGADIKAKRHGEILIVEVKGYPSKVYERGSRTGQPKRTNPATQARHWVAEALLTAILRQAESKVDQVALAFPDFPVYRNLLARLRDCFGRLGLQLLLVRESGDVSIVIDRGLGEHGAAVRA